MSVSLIEVEKYSWLHNHRRTEAMVSEKVACCLSYQAAQRWYACPVENRRCASRVTMAYSTTRQGVVRAMAWSDHCRSVSMPRWARASSNVTSICQRWTKHSRIKEGVAC